MRRALLVAALAACFAALPAAAAGGPTVLVQDNAFVRGVQRPEVRVARGTTITWSWRSQQSHGVSAVAGPERFSARIRARGVFRHRFTRVGTYRFVCPLHAPGMKMTVVVRR
jgi:plastocyanin